MSEESSNLALRNPFTADAVHNEREEAGDVARIELRHLAGKRQANQKLAILALVAFWGGILTALGCDGRGAATPISPRSDIVAEPSLLLVLSESALNIGEVPARAIQQGWYKRSRNKEGRSKGG